jgi:hypothetical protein
MKTMEELATVQSELIKKFGDDVYVNAQENLKNLKSSKGLVLTVSFINSRLNEKTKEERFKRAGEAAKVVTATYARIKSVSTIWVGFVRQKTRMVVFHYSEGFDFYPFDRNAQPLLNGPEDTSAPKLETTANYFPKENVSNVFAYGIQLEGQPGKDGVTVLPRFTTTGDVNVKKGPPPKTVEFDFSSYSGTPRFQQTVPVTFIADAQLILQTKATFHGNDAQFCSVSVPYAAFRQMIAAKELTIKVDANEYSLTPIELDAMRKMDDYLTK